jgi:hypothetical protein
MSKNVSKSARYTAILSHGKKVFFVRNSSYFEDLQAKLISLIHDKLENAHGRIIDNHKGETIRTFSRQTCLE